jgi:hypothetical protein
MSAQSGRSRKRTHSSTMLCAVLLRLLNPAVVRALGLGFAAEPAGTVAAGRRHDELEAPVVRAEVSLASLPPDSFGLLA